VVSYLHPLHTEDTSTCSQGMVRMTRPRPRLMGRHRRQRFFFAPSVTRQSPFARAPRGAGVH
jgi:hypothetical protein